MTDSMEQLSAKIRNAHMMVKDEPVRLSKDDDKAAASLLYNDIKADLEAYRGLLAKLGCPKAESIVKALIQNCQDAKDAYDTEVVNSK